MGTDPELFLQTGGRIIGSEKVLPDNGLQDQYGAFSIVQDGVQLEVQPRAAKGTQNLGANLSQAFKLLRGHLAQIPEVICCFNGVVEVNREELDSL